MSASSAAEGSVSGLFYYPVKSLPGVPLEEALLTARGIADDRLWMLVRDGGKFITQRQEHRLALLSIMVEDRGFRISSPTGDVTVLPTRMDSDRRLDVHVWKDQVCATRGPAESAAFFSDYLGYSCEPVFMGKDGSRFARAHAPNGTPLSFADAYPGLLTSVTSLRDLDQRASIRLTMNRFRPNMVVTGFAPYAEDGWLDVRAGEVEIRCVKACARCVLTTVDPKTGTAGKEPLRTLAEYRRIGSEVFFGQNFVVTKPGKVRLGDDLTVLRRKKAPFPDV